MSQGVRLMTTILLVISAILASWGLIGLLGYYFLSIELGLQNEKFPAGLQFLHFFSILVTGTFFVVGYIVRWRYKPFATVVMYAVLATLCFIVTVDFDAFGSGSTRFIPMVIEYIAYIGLSEYLLRSSEMLRHFQLVSEVTKTE